MSAKKVTFWRVGYQGTDEHYGYQFFADREAAKRAKDAAEHRDPGDPEADEEEATITEIEVELTAAGVLAALDEYATHMTTDRSQP